MKKNVFERPNKLRENDETTIREIAETAVRDNAETTVWCRGLVPSREEKEVYQ